MKFSDFTKAKQDKLNWLYDQDPTMSQSYFEMLYYCVDDNGYLDSEIQYRLEDSVR